MLKFVDERGKPVRAGFRDADHMDEVMIERWNRVVQDGDKVYHLGDVGFDQENLSRVLPRLRGQKRLILGNHDGQDMGFYRKHFKKIMSWRHFTDNGLAIICTHFPLHPSSFLGRYDGRCINVHGHIHARTINDPRYVNISVEQIDYTPVNYDWLMSRARRLAA